MPSLVMAPAHSAQQQPGSVKTSLAASCGEPVNASWAGLEKSRKG